MHREERGFLQEATSEPELKEKQELATRMGGGGEYFRQRKHTERAPVAGPGWGTRSE